MKRLHIYVIKTFIGPFIMIFFICMFILLMQFLWKYVDEMVGKGLDWGMMGQLIFYASFTLLPLAFPLTMLISSIMAFGDLGENYELVAMKASGISLFRIMKPLIILAIVISGIAFYFANYIIPVSNLKFYTILMSLKEQKPELVLKEGVFTNDIDGYSIKIDKKDRKTNVLYNVMIYDHTNMRANQNNVTVADSGFMKMTEDKKYMVLTLYDGINYREDENNSRNPDNSYPHYEDKFKTQILNIKLKDFAFNKKDESIFSNIYRMMRIDQLLLAEDSMHIDYNRRIRTLISQLMLNNTLKVRLRNLTATHDSLKQKLTVEPDTLVNIDQVFAKMEDWRKQELLVSVVNDARNNHQVINNNERSINERKKSINRHEMERHKKFTLSLAVLIFFFIGAPLGAIIRKGGLGMPVVASILLFIIYYILSMMGEKSAREDLWQMSVGMWFSSFIFLALGIWLTYKAVTDANIMRAETYTDFFKKLKMKKFGIASTRNENPADNQ
jgi:lipopolysaccharide export system permease protein